jgi:CRP/FNR family transcriptional regulator
MNDTEFLSRVSLFSLTKKSDLERIAKLANRHTFDKGDVIIKEGEPDNRLFIIVKGEVEVIKAMGEKRERRLGILGPESYFGEMALVDDLVRSASVVANKKTEALSLHQETFRQEVERSPTIAFELLHLLSRRIRALEKSTVNILGDFLPSCANCRKIRSQDGSWTSLEKYVSNRCETEFSHSICPECAERLYPQFYDKE